MKQVSRWTLTAAATMLACAGAAAGPLDKLDVRLSLAQPVVQGDVSVAVDVSVTNSTGHAVKALRWQLPSDQLHGPLFKVTKEDGTAARYVGPQVKRAAPRAADYVVIEAGATLNYRVELTRSFVLGNGRYAIEYTGQGNHPNEARFTGAGAAVWTSGRTAQPDVQTDGNGAEMASITYTGGCTSSEQSTLVSAVNAATTYSTESKNYLNGTPSGTRRYVEWFGKFNTTRWNRVGKHFAKIDNAFKTKPLTLDCACTDSGIYAYVFGNEPYKIYLCGAFWSAPMTGTDSKGGTLVHEMSHFDIIADTGDWAYGQGAARQLAKDSPKKAVDNADSHEYFAENTPQLP